jgi:hypothetical protein
MIPSSNAAWWPGVLPFTSCLRCASVLRRVVVGCDAAGSTSWSTHVKLV